jgi:hypothetical protein
VVDVELTLARTPGAVLALKLVPKHEVATCESDGDSRCAFVAEQMQDARHAQCATHDRQTIVRGAHRHPSPCEKVVPFARVVDGVSNAAIHEHERSPSGGHAHRRKKPVQEEHGKAQDIPPLA